MHGNITTPLPGRGGRGQRRREKVHGVRERGGGGGASEGACHYYRRRNSKMAAGY